MKLIEFQNGITPASAEIMNAFQDNIRESVEKDILFESDEGTQNTIILNNSATYYKYLKIIYSVEASFLDAPLYETRIVPVFAGEEKKSTLNSFYIGSINMYIFNTQIICNDSSISFYGNRILKLSQNTYELLNTPSIKILKIVGVKE